MERCTRVYEHSQGHPGCSICHLLDAEDAKDNYAFFIGIVVFWAPQLVFLDCWIPSWAGRTAGECSIVFNRPQMLTA